MSDVSLVLVLLTIGFASTVKAAVGMGFPMIAVPIVSNIVDPRTTVVAISLPTLLSNLLIIRRGGGTRSGARRLLVVMGFLVIGTVLGAYLLAYLDVTVLSLMVGLAAIAFVGLSVSRANLSIPATKERYVSPIVGLASGVLGGTTNIFGPVLASYLHSLRLTKKEFVFSITLLFTISGITQVLSYFQLGLYSRQTLLYALVACVPTVLGIYFGLKLQDRLPPNIWNALVLTLIFLSGLNLIVRSLF